MEQHRLIIDDIEKTIIIDNMTPKETVEAIEQLIDEYQFGRLYFDTCELECNNNYATITFCNGNPKCKYNKLEIRTINLLRSSEDRECAIKIITLMKFYIFNSITPIICNSKNYHKRNNCYSILICMDGLFRWENDYSANFICD